MPPLPWLLRLIGALAPLLRLDNGVARTPPMGWNSWNHFGCDVSAQLIRETADAMVASGLRDAGYQYVVIDDCWQVARDAGGRLVADSARFPGGIKPLADYVHAKGLKFGIYTDAGRLTCQGRPGSYQHEDQDARTFGEWGVDYVKVDWCYAEGLDARTQYARFRDALAKAGRPIVFSICEWGSATPWEWGAATGNLWRTTGDIQDNWNSMVSIVDLSAQHASAARPGAWNDPDMLEVGNGGMTDDEYRAHLSLWAIMAAPLMAGNDLRSMSVITREILSNPEVIAVDQDSLGVQGLLVAEPAPELQVWMKPLRDGARAVVLFNRSALQTVISASWWRLRLSGPARVRDLWAHADRGTFSDRFSATVPAHGVVMLRVTPAAAR
jgi:alpha-galactosidase